MPDRTPDELARYWDALTIGSDPNSIALDPSLAEVIRRFEQSEDVPSADPTFIANLMEDLMYAHALPHAGPRKPSWAAGAPRLGGLLNKPLIPIPERRSRWLPALISAALLLAALGIAFNQLDWGRGDGREPAGPAIFAPGTPSPEAEATDEILLEVTVPADAFVNPIPGGDRLSALFYHSAIPANSTSTWETTVRAEHPGPEIEYILEGTITVTSEGPAQVIRADGDGTPEDVPAGTAVELGPGDAVIHRVENQSTWVTGEVPVELFAGYAVATNLSAEYPPDEWTYLDYTYVDNAGPVPTGPSVVRLRQVVMEPDEVIAFDPGVVKLVLIEEGGSGVLGEGSDGSITLKGATETTTVYIFSVAPAEGSSATPTP